MNKKYSLSLFSVIVLGLALLLSGFTSTQPGVQVDRETMQRSNQLYENGRIQEAAQLYQQLVDQGLEHSALFYNLGNAYLQQGELGKAILNYERAARIAPRDADIEANLAYARTQVNNAFESEAGSPLEQWVELSTSILTLNETSLLTLGLFWLLGVLLILYRHNHSQKTRQVLQFALMCALVLFALSAFTLGGRVYLQTTHPQAVVVAKSVALVEQDALVKQDALVEQNALVNEPIAETTSEFRLHSGTEVTVLEKNGSWARLSTPGGELQGWAPLEAVETINQS